MTDATARDFGGSVEVEIDGHCFVLTENEAEQFAGEIHEVLGIGVVDS